MDKNFVINQDIFFTFVKVLCAKGKLKDGETVSEEICRRCQLNGKVEATKEH